jgi:N-methylhydantoinase B
VRGGHDAHGGGNYLVRGDGQVTELAGSVDCLLQPGQSIIGVDNGGGGYGDPAERDPEKVLADVIEGYETLERARDVYKVAITKDAFGFINGFDPKATAQMRNAV